MNNFEQVWTNFNKLVRDWGRVGGLDGLAEVVGDVGAGPANDPLSSQTFAENHFLTFF